jgi:Tfp pilus assembly protein PilF
MTSPQNAAITFWNRAVQIKEQDPHISYKLITSSVDVWPEFLQGWMGLGVTNVDMGFREAAIANFRRAVELDPNDHVAWTNLGHQLYFVGKLDQSLAATRRSMDLRPDLPFPYCNISLIQSVQGKLESSLDSAKKAYEMAPELPEIELGLAFAHLFKGDFARGFKHFESRFDYNATLRKYHGIPYPKWNGEDLTGKSLFIVSEQGIGDTLSFSRFVPMVAEKADKIIFQVQSELMRPLGIMLSPYQNVSLQPLPETWPACDYWTSPNSLVVGLGLTTEQIVSQPGLPPPQMGMGPPPQWKAQGRKLHIGVAWAGAPANGIDVWRSMPMQNFLELYRVPGIQLYSLQVGPHAQDVHSTGSAALVRDMSPYLRDVLDTMVIMRDLDLVITVESLVGHIGGSIGADTWVLNSHNGGDYRLGRKGSKSIWYPRHRIFRQDSSARWEPVFEQVIAALKERVG